MNRIDWDSLVVIVYLVGFFTLLIVAVVTA